MSAGIDMTAFAETVNAIADEVFTAMVDGEPGHLNPWFEAPPVLGDPIHSWVDVHGSHPGRVLVTTERETATRLTRALLVMDPDDEVSDADFVDAFGEIANVVGGNVKALVPDPGPLTLPLVNATAPSGDGAVLLHETLLDWRGAAVSISLWSLP